MTKNKTMQTEVKRKNNSTNQPVKPCSNGKFEFERDLPDDFRESWPDRAEIAERDRLIRGRLVRRVHWENFGLTDFEYGGPIFDANLMVQSIINRMENTGAVGYSWAIVRYGQLVDAGGMGDARTASEVDPRVMTETTRMVSASLAKPVCAVTIMKLVEDKVFSLDDLAYPFIQEAFPNVHPSIEAVTIRHLLTHTSGIVGSSSLSNFGSVLQQPTVTPPGTNGPDGNYENANYWFLAYVVEGATGTAYRTYARDNILVPMTITNMNNEVDDEAPCLYYAANSVSNGFTWGDFQATAIGAYGWFASAIDWAKFMAYFRYDQVLEKQSRLTMLNAPERYFGFRHWNNQPRGSYYGHGGDFSSNGGKAFHGGMMGFPDGVDAVLLTNSDDVANPENVLIQAYHDAYA